MALTLPIETLANMTVSFKARLADGTFAFDMAPLDGRDMAGRQPESGMKLHLSVARDSAGVALTLFNSGNSRSHLDEGEIDMGFEYSTAPGVPHLAADPDRDANLELVSFSQPVKPSDLDLPLGAFEYLFDMPDIPNNIDASLLDCLNPTYFNELHDSSGSGESNISHYLVAEAADTPATTPSTSSEPSHACSPTLSSQNNLQFHAASCPRPIHAGSKRKSAKLKPHEPKAQKSFPCTMGCAMRFSRKHDRLRHEIAKHGRVCQWGCIVCLTGFSFEATLQNHKCGKLNFGRTG
ncbi:hypothetical protein DFH09DRAFT_1319841 [Mycena vulgaris]|nr:hypothetical protein DFH09DRAFT_1319841 [Mycena vulgaris]